MAEMTPEVRKEIILWLVSVIIGAVVVIGTLFASRWVMPVEDQLGAIRKFALALGPVVFSIITAGGALVWLDYVTPGNYLQKIGEDSIACAILSGCVFIGLCFVLCVA